MQISLIRPNLSMMLYNRLTMSQHKQWESQKTAPGIMINKKYALSFGT